MLKRLKCFTHRFKVCELHCLLYTDATLIKMFQPFEYQVKCGNFISPSRSLFRFLLSILRLTFCARLNFVSLNVRRDMRCVHSFSLFWKSHSSILWKEKSQHQPKIAWNVKVFYRFKKKNKLNPGKKDDPSYRYLRTTRKKQIIKYEWKSEKRNGVREEWSDYKSPLYICIQTKMSM